MSLTYIVLNLLLQNELKPIKMQSDTGQFQRQVLLLRLLDMELRIVERKLANGKREIEKYVMKE